MFKVFLSYRREDSQHATGRVFDRLVDHFGREGVFKDVDSIPPGTDFRQILLGAVGQCDVLLAVIGPHWLDCTDQEGRRRLENDSDFVRLEIETALRQGVPVIPLIVGGGTIPRAGDLPPSLQELSFRNGVAIRPDPDFHRDMEWLLEALKIYQAVQVLKLRVSHYRSEQATYLGDLGSSSDAACFDDDVRVQVQLNRAAYCYLLAFNPDGTEQLCSPRDAALPPDAAAELSYPPDGNTYFGLTDGVGLQVFVLAAARHPLPPYVRWRAGAGTLPWRPVVAEGVWRFDDRRFELLGGAERGQERIRRGPPPPLIELCTFLGNRPEIDMVHALAFPVKLGDSAGGLLLSEGSSS